MISSITHWVGYGIRSAAGIGVSWQTALVATIAAIALPQIARLANCRSRWREAVHPQEVIRPQEEVRPEAALFHRWYAEGKEIQFFREGNEIRIDVLRSVDRQKLASTYLDLSRYPNMAMFLKIAKVSSGQELAGWQENGLPIFVPPSECLHTWHVDEGEISLLSKNGGLSWRYSENASTHFAPVDLGGKSKEVVINQLVNNEQPVKWDKVTNSPILIKTDQPNTKWTLDNRELCLRVRHNQIIWQLVNHALKTTSSVPVNPELLRTLSVEDRISRLECQTVDPQRLDQVVLNQVYVFTKNQQSSRLDPKIVVDKDRWAVTLIDMGRCQEYYPATWGGHAAIAVEGIEDNFPFTMVLDLVPAKDHPGFAIVRVQEYSPNMEIKYAGKAETGLVPKNKVQNMLNQIRKDRDITKNKPFHFNILGMDSVLNLTPGHNCVTWATDRLALCGVVYTSDFVGILFTAPKFYV